MTAPVYLSINEFPGDGVTTQFEFNFAGGYISRDHVKAYTTDATGVITAVDILPGMWVNDYTVDLGVSAPVGGKVRIYRETPRTAPLVNFVDGARITEDSLDLLARQTVLGVAEAFDAGAYATANDLLGAAGAALAAAELAVANAASSEDAAAASAVAAADSAVVAATFNPANYVPRAGNVTMTGPLDVPAGASGAQVPQAQEIPALVRAFMHAAVSQSGGTPTGGIVEYGANANGTYWRLSNRLQICITAVASGVTSAATSAAGVFTSAAMSQTWPAAFSTAPEVSVSTRNSAVANCWAGDCTVSATGITGLRAFSTVNTASTVLSVVALGRWY